MKTLLILTLLLTTAACKKREFRVSFGPVAVTVNGHPIDANEFVPADRQKLEARFQAQHHRQPTAADQSKIDAQVQAERCGRLLYMIEQTLRDEHMERLAGPVTEADLDRVRKSMESPTEAFKRGHASMVAMQKAMDAVDKGADPADVYKRLLNYNQTVDPRLLADWEKMRRDESTRKAIKRAANQTLAQYLQQQGEANKAGLVLNAKRAKLEEAIDEQIARSDPTFAKALAHSKRPVNQRISNPAEAFTSEERTYLIDQREEYWFTKVRSQAKIVIHDPTLQSCDISKYIGDAKPQH